MVKSQRKIRGILQGLFAELDAAIERTNGNYDAKVLSQRSQMIEEERRHSESLSTELASLKQAEILWRAEKSKLTIENSKLTIEHSKLISENADLKRRNALLEDERSRDMNSRVETQDVDMQDMAQDSSTLVVSKRDISLSNEMINATGKDSRIKVTTST